MIWMGEKVGGELVIVPYESMLEILVNGVEVYFGKLFIQDKSVEAVHQQIDACGFVCSNPRMLLAMIVTYALSRLAFCLMQEMSVRTVATVIFEGKTELTYKSVLIVPVVSIESRISIAYRGIQTESGVYLIVSIDVRLKGMETLRIIAVTIESLDVVIAYVATQRESWGEVDVLSETIIDGSRELGVESHIVGAKTYDAICGAIAKSQCAIYLG